MNDSDIVSESSDWILNEVENSALKEEEEEEPDTPDYQKNDDAPIPVAKFKNKDGKLYINLNSTSFIGMFGPSGSGKTTGDMTIATRAYMRGRKIMNLADTDLHTTNLDNNGGVSQNLINKMGLVEGEKPTEVKQKTLYPKYLHNMFQDRNVDTPTNVDKFTLGFKDVSQSELKFLLGHGLNKNQKQALQSILSSLDMNDLTFDKIYTAIDEADNLNYQVSDKIERNVEVLEDTEIISSRYSKNIPGLVRDGYSLGLGMKGFSSLDNDDYYLMEFYAKKVSEILIEELGSEVPMFGIFPEAHHLMPRGRNSLLADHIKRISTFYGRRSDFPLILDSQNPSQISEQLLDELNHVFLGCDKNGKPISGSEWKKVLSVFSIVSNHNKEYMEWSERIQELNYREFLYISPKMDDASDARVVEFLAPLTSNP